MGDKSWQVDGFGVRDKSWGPRDWGAGQRSEGTQKEKEREESPNSSVFSTSSFSTEEVPNPFVNWFSMNFGADSALGGSCFRQPNGGMRGAGWIQRDGTSAARDATFINEGLAEFNRDGKQGYGIAEYWHAVSKG